MLGMSVAQTFRRKTKTTKNHQNDRDDQRQLDVVNRGANGGGAVDDHVEVDRRIDGGLQLGHSARTRSTVSMMFAPGWRENDQDEPGWPLIKPALRMSSTRIGDRADVGRAHCTRRCASHDQRLIFTRLEKLIAVGDSPRVAHRSRVRLWDDWRWRTASARANIFEADAVAVELRRVDLERARPGWRRRRRKPGRCRGSARSFCARTESAAS